MFPGNQNVDQAQAQHSYGIIKPDNLFYRLWQHFLVLLSVYFCFGSTMLGTFSAPPSPPYLWITNVAVSVFFFIDIILSLFFVAYWDKNTFSMVDNRRRIVTKTVKTVFLDVVLIVPFEVVAKQFYPSSIILYQSFSMLALLRFFYSIRIYRCFSELEENEKINFIVVRIARMMWVCYLVCHYGGCVFYLLAASHGDATNTWFSLVDSHFVELGFIQRYVTSIYLAVISFTTVGYGDLHAISTDEMVFSVIFLLIDFGLVAYVTTTVIYLVLPDIGPLGKYRARRVRVLGYCRHYHLSDDLCKEVSDHLKLEYQSRSQPSEENGILNSLPTPVKGRILTALSTKLGDNTMLNRLSNPIRFQLIQAMEPVMFPDNTSIILENEAPMFLYFVLSGSVGLNTGGEPVDTVTSGEVFGETCVFFNRPQAFTATTNELSQLLMLDRVKLMSILQSCPNDTSRLISGHLEDLNTKPYLNEVRKEFENNATIGRIDLPVSLLFAVERGYNRLFNRLVEEYPDVNESDSSGRTLLHLLASKGDLQKYQKLIEMGADPTLKDSSGNVPLPLWNNNGDDA